ncbi:hypothetical protein DEIPH_ctg046orf0043 [Deinococcus phoenicis]|uniref:Uncharacterized protein n=1 Tax=Deinococcus phoenicis TaxID=1476583 RepID=A0A016QML9_9DEIO|nr:tetratricopeptide repeat protein [Deinococcus phoenicis]EYB67241.1 hypothetical protein DEIPH_ctg046orf0043 [Deinococcus phoenicis]
MSSTMAVLGQRLRALPARRVGLAAWLWGEAGIGKTHASRALLREAPCRSLTLAATLPLAELVRALPRPARLRVWTQIALEGVQEGRAVAAPAADILAALLAQLAPFVLHLEDLHGADAARLELTGQLAAAVARTRGAGLLVTSRLPPPDTWPEGDSVVALERLSPRAAAALLDAEAGAELPPGAAAWVFERARGNPLFTLEYFRLLARQGHLWNSGDRWRWRAPGDEPLPVTVEAIIEQILEGVGAAGAAGRLMAALALLPPGVDDARLTAITALTPQLLAEARLELQRRGVLAPGGFAHPLYREVARKQLRPEQRQALARQAITVFRHDPQRAAHLIDEAQLEPREAAALFLQAAEAAGAGDGDGPHSARLLARAAQHASGPEQVHLALRAARGLREADLPEALRLAELAHHLAPQQAGAAGLYAELLAGQGRLAEAEACLQGLPAEERTGRAWWSRLIRLRGAARHHGGVLELWQAHPELHRQPDPGVVYAVAFASAHSARLGQAASLAGGALAQPDLDAPTRCDLINVLGIVRYNQNDFEGAAQFYAQALEQARAAGLTHLEAVYLSNRAMALGELGQSRARLADLGESLRLYRAQGQLLQATRTQVALADAYLDLARYEEAEELLLESRDFLARLGPSEHLIECEYRLSVLYRHWAPPHGGLLSLRHARAALAHARQLALPGKLAWALCYASTAESCFAGAGEGQRLAQEALTLATQLNAPGPSGMARFALAFALEAAGQPDEALRAFEATEAALLAQGIVDAAQEVGLEADRLSGRRQRAAERLAWFEQAGMKNLAQVTRRYFPGLGEAAGQGTPPGSARPQASPAHLRLEVLGEMRCGPPGACAAVRGRKRRELLAGLLGGRLRGRPDVSRPALMDALYPHAGEDQAAAALKELVHQTRAALGAGVIRTTGDGYALGDLESDAETFLKTGDTALWRGPYLAGEEPASDGLITDTLYGALGTRAQALSADQPAEAARLGRLLCEANPYDLAALALTLNALRAAGNHRSLGRFYHAARQRLLEVGERLPEEWTTFLQGHVGA